MIICQNCTAGLLDGTIFCDNCGADLSDSVHQRGAKPLPAMPLPTTPTQDAAHYEPRIILSETGDEIQLPVGPAIVIGRAGQNGPRPDIDLGPFRAAEAGVSRTHVVLDLAGPSPRIKDLDSTNGTYVNGYRIMPHRSVALSRGDQIYLGQLALRVVI